MVAADMSELLLHRLESTARTLGVADRVHTIVADLDAVWPAFGTVDLVWASSSLHHMAEPDRVLTEVRTVLHPGGLLVVAETDSFPRFLPDDVGPGLEARCHGALAGERAAAVPHLGSDWRARLVGAGFTIEAEQTFAIDLTPPLPAATGRYGPESLLQRDDLTVRTARTVWVGRRP